MLATGALVLGALGCSVEEVARITLTTKSTTGSTVELAPQAGNDLLVDQGIEGFWRGWVGGSAEVVPSPDYVVISLFLVDAVGHEFAPIVFCLDPTSELGFFDQAPGAARLGTDDWGFFDEAVPALPMTLTATAGWRVDEGLYNELDLTPLELFGRCEGSNCSQWGADIW